MVTKLNRSLISDRQDAGCPHPDLRHLLAAVPRLLHLRQPQPRRDEHEAHPAHLSRVLLVRHDPLNGQPNRLLLDEQKVTNERSSMILKSLAPSCCKYPMAIFNSVLCK